MISRPKLMAATSYTWHLRRDCPALQGARRAGWEVIPLAAAMPWVPASACRTCARPYATAQRTWRRRLHLDRRQRAWAIEKGRTDDV